MLVLDAGTGIVGLCDELSTAPAVLPILLTHYHWDHIQGLPVLLREVPRDTRVVIWGPTFPAGNIQCLSQLFHRPFGTIPFDELPSPPALEVLDAAAYEVAGFPVRALPLTHPGGAFAYRIGGDAGDFVYATDHEFGVEAVDAALAAFVRGASALVLDAQFTPEEAPGVKGWGHSTWKQAAEFAAEVGVQRLWLFHHKPGRRDDELESLVDFARAIF